MMSYQSQPLKWFIAWWIFGWCLVMWVIYQSLTSTPIQAPHISFGDKIGHFSAYFVMMAWFAQLYTRKAHHIYLVLFIAMGVIMEVLQGQTAYRSFEYGDMLANSLGASLAWWLARKPFATCLLRVEQRLFS